MRNVHIYPLKVNSLFSVTFALFMASRLNIRSLLFFSFFYAFLYFQFVIHVDKELLSLKIWKE